jgi:hypothetical protein
VKHGKDGVRVARSRAEDSIDTVMFRDGQIRVQTTHYTLQRTG